MQIIEQFKSLFTKVPSPEINNQHNELPQNIISTLNQEIQGLPCHSKYIEILQSTLEESLSKWQENPEANELVILSSSIEPLPQIIQTALTDWNYENLSKIKVLSWSNRPQNYCKIVPKLQKDLGLPAQLDFDNNSGKFQELIIIPCFEFCFLREIHGLDGIEFLRNRIFQDHSRFWLIGCNSLTWQYLDHVYQIKSYFEKTLSLPTLTGEEISQWLTPVINQLEFAKNDQDQEKNLSKIQEHFEDLATISQGLSSVAAQFWIQSLSLVNIENNNNQAETEENILVEYNKVKLLDLPDLTADDRYLLFSLLLHREMNLSDLALSLGEFESTIQFQIQKLLSMCIIQRENDFLSINPAYYLKLHKYLKKYNFITDLIQ
ncbi:MAG: hypothetical protein AB4080_19450 [Trichodesmium sp.]